MRQIRISVGLFVLSALLAGCVAEVGPPRERVVVHDRPVVHERVVERPTVVLRP